MHYSDNKFLVLDTWFIALVLIAVLVPMLFPQYAVHAAEVVAVETLSIDEHILTQPLGPVTPYTTFVPEPKKQPKWSMRVPMTAYSSTPDQTDDTPFITASGTHVRDGIIAANFLPIGTIVMFPELYGDKEFVVEDRMNVRYYYRADIWMETRQEAINFGFKVVTIEVY